jgi:hypothetical protein
MIIYKDNTYIIKNWYKYQSVDKYEKTLEQNRVRQKRFRDKKKEESNVNQTLGNGTEEIRKEIEDNKIDENIKVGENGSGFQTIDF